MILNVMASLDQDIKSSWCNPWSNMVHNIVLDHRTNIIGFNSHQDLEGFTIINRSVGTGLSCLMSKCPYMWLWLWHRSCVNMGGEWLGEFIIIYYINTVSRSMMTTVRPISHTSHTVRSLRFLHYLLPVVVPVVHFFCYNYGELLRFYIENPIRKPISYWLC